MQNLNLKIFFSPVRRVPPILLTKMRRELYQHFTENEADGVRVLVWAHKQVYLLENIVQLLTCLKHVIPSSKTSPKNVT